MEIVRHTDVLIVGAGPSGLMMAAQLLRFGIQPTIIDAKSGPDKTSKAIALQARSLEFLRQLGLVDQLLAAGVTCYGIQVHGYKKQVLGQVDFSGMDPATPFPFLLLLGQDETEKVLLSQLTAHTCPVLWETRLISLQQDDRSAIVQVDYQGATQHWACKWVIAADGAGSMVRQLLGIPFEGKRYAEQFFLADVEVAGSRKRKVHFFLPKRGFLGIFPLGNAGQYRLFGLLPETKRSDSETIQYLDIKDFVDEILGYEFPVSRCTWINRVRLHKRMADQFVRQRCFLLGDAAHVHSPIGGQGMNTGMQDAANLAWKLAGVLEGRMSTQLLHTYQQERMPVAKQILQATDRAFGTVMGMRTWLAPLRDILIKAGIRLLETRRSWLASAFDQLAQLAIHYRDTPLSVHHAIGRRIQAGDRLPFLPIFDEKKKTNTDLHRWCEKPGFALLVLGTISHHHLHIIGQWIRQKYPRGMNLYYLPYSTANSAVFDAFEVNPSGTKIVLVRPDMYIAYINDMLNVALIDTYMEEVIRWKYFDSLPENQ